MICLRRGRKLKETSGGVMKEFEGKSGRRWWSVVFPVLPLVFSVAVTSVFLFSCGTGDDMTSGGTAWELPEGLKAVSVYGEREFIYGGEEEISGIGGKVLFRGWEADAPQTIFITDGEKTYFMSYVIPEEIAKELGVQDKLSHFLSGEYINADAKTTALALVMISPPYFWSFTPRALVFSASFVVEHKDFLKLVEMIEMAKPGELFSGRYPEVFATAYRIAGDVREKLLSAEKTAQLTAPRLGEKSSHCENDMSGIADVSEAPGLKVKFTVRHMVFYGGAVFNSDDAGDTSNIARFFVLKAQDAKIDLSLDNILDLNIINPEVDTEVPVPTDNKHAIRVEKGVELSTSIFTDPIKRIGLVSNFGRIVKYAIEVAVPNIAACIPDGDTWGAVLATAQNIVNNGEIAGIRDILSSSWDEIVRNVVNLFVDQNSWVYGLLGKIGFASCAYSPGFIVSQIAATLKNFPIVKIYDAFTKYIPFGYELWTKPKSGAVLVIQGFPLGAEVPIIKDIYPTPASSPGRLFVELMGDCTTCKLRINCPEFGVMDFNLVSTCGQPSRVDIPLNFYGDGCQAMLIYKYQEESGGILPGFVKNLLGIGNSPATVELITSKWSLDIVDCPECVYNPSAEGPGGGKGGKKEGGGCNSSYPMNPYHLTAMLVIFLAKEIRRKKVKRREKVA